MSEAGEQRVDEFVDSCHCPQGPDPSSCDGWLQHRKCDSLAVAIAARLRAVEEELAERNRVGDGLADALEEWHEAFPDKTAHAAEADAQRLTAELETFSQQNRAWHRENTRLTAELETFSQQNRAWIRENTRLTAEVARFKDMGLAAENENVILRKRERALVEALNLTLRYLDDEWHGEIIRQAKLALTPPPPRPGDVQGVADA